MAAKEFDSEHLIVLRRPWVRSRNLRIPDRIFVMAKSNYKVYADLCLSKQFMVRQLSVLHTGAAPNLIHRDLIPPELRENIPFGSALDIADANNRPIRTSGYITLFMRLGTCLVQLNFIVCDSLAAPVILGCDFCDRWVEAIRPHKRIVEMTYGSLISIVRKPMRATTRKHVPLLAAQEAEHYSPVSTKLHIARSVQLPPETQVWVEDTTKQSGLLAVQLLPGVNEQQQLSLANGVVFIESDTPFKVLVANFGNSCQYLVKKQVIGSVLPHSKVVVATKIRFEQVLGVSEPKEGEEAAFLQTEHMSENR